MDQQSLINLINAKSNDAASKLDGMVYQVWEDGEITLQKSGSLLNQRSLHCIVSGMDFYKVPASFFPHQVGEHGYIYITNENDGIDIREAIKSYCSKLKS